MISLLEGMATTRAIRRYTDEPIPLDDLTSILWHATRAPSGSNRQPFRFVVLRDGPLATEAKALLGGAFRDMWAAKRRADGYEAGSGAEGSSPKARMARTMQHFVDHVEATPVVVLPCLVRYRDPHPSEGASIYPACQNLLLAARALGYGGVMTTWHAVVEPELRALLLKLIERGGVIERRKAEYEKLNPPQRETLRKLGIKVGGLDVFVLKMLRPGPLGAWQALTAARGKRTEPPHPSMPSVLAQAFEQPVPPGYRRCGAQAVRVDMVERLLHFTHNKRNEVHVGGKRRERALDPTLAISIGLTKPSWERLLRTAGFQVRSLPPLPSEVFGPPSPPLWRWAPELRSLGERRPRGPTAGNPFAELAKSAE